MAKKQQPAHIEALRAAMMERLTGDAETGSLVTTGEGNIVAQHLPEGMTLEQVHAVDEFRQSVIEVAADVAVTKAIEMAGQNKDLSSVVGTLPMLAKGEELQLMLNIKERDLKIAHTQTFTNTKTGLLKASGARLAKELDELFKD